MRFEVMLESDRIAGRVGSDVKNAPVPGATFNNAEDRWELEVPDLQCLLKLAGGYWLSVLPVVEGEDGELSLVEIMDAPEPEEEEEEPQEPN